MTASDKTIALVGLYDIEWFINNKSVIIPENSAIAIHDNNSEKTSLFLEMENLPLVNWSYRKLDMSHFVNTHLILNLLNRKTASFLQSKKLYLLQLMRK